MNVTNSTGNSGGARRDRRIGVETMEGRVLLAAPVILKVSDAVEPGNAFDINGGGIDAGTLDVAIAPDTTGTAPVTPPAGAIHPQILQTDKDSQFAVCRMPATATPGVYDVWVKNASGWSTATTMNAARALFQSEYQAYAGLNIEVVGRNFDRSEFGGTTATQVRLNNGAGGVYPQAIASLNPCNVAFTVGSSAPIGTYYVEVSSDGGVHWSRPSSGQTLSIIANTGSDPLGLGVSWAQDYKWSNVFNVTSYGANGGDTLDDTTAVKNAVSAAEAAGGGVVYLPNGSYYLRYVHLAPGVVLEGQDEYNTKIYYNGAGGPGSFIYSYSDSHSSNNQPVMQLQGIARLSILMPDPNSTTARPDVFINLGDRNTGNDMTLRQANRLFVANVNLNYGWTGGNSDPVYAHRGIGALWLGKERILFQNNSFVGWFAPPANTYLNQYFTCRNNNFEYSAGYVHDTATYAFFENNTIKIHPEYNQDSHGIFTRSDAYVSGNYVEGAGDASNVANDGEGICSEAPNGGYNYGAVISASATSLTVAAKVALVVPVTYYGDLSVMITQGTGQGQLRKVTSIDTTNSIITVDAPFTIVPDSTSRFTLFSPLRNFTVYKNTLKNCASGLVPYGNQFDALVADNTLIDTVGIYVWAARNSDGSTYAHDSADSYIRITGNTITGVSRRSNTSAIAIYSGRFDGKTFYDTMVYSVEILGNSIAGDLTKPLNGKMYFAAYNGIYVSSYIYSNMSDGSGSGDVTNTLIQDNTLSQLQCGIMLTKCDYGQVITGNATASTVIQLLRDGGSQNTVIASDNYSPQGQNVTGQGALITSTLSPISSQGSTDINIIHDGITPQLSPGYDGSYDDVQPSLQYDNAGASPQYYGYTFSGNQAFGKIVFVEGRHYSNGGWFANGSLIVQVRQNGIWNTVPTSAIVPYPNSNTQASFGTGFQAYGFVLDHVVGDGIRIYGTAGGSAKYSSISELEAWGTPLAPASLIGGSGNDTYLLRVDPSNSQFTQVFVNTPPNLSPTYLLQRSQASSLSIGGGGGDDSLTLDLSNGDPLPAGGVSFDGGTAGSSSGDWIYIQGSSGADSLSIDASDITNASDSRLLSYASVEHIQFNLMGGNDLLSQSANPSAAEGINWGGGQDTLNVNGGSVAFAGDAGATSGGLSLNVSGSGSAVSFTGTQHLAALNLSSGGTARLMASASAASPAVLNVSSLGISGAGSKLDLSNNRMLAGSTLAAIRAQIIAAQLYSSRSGGVLGSQDLENGQIEVCFTLAGDSNLDGVVDVTDLGNLATHWQSASVWSGGDFNYDGIVDVTDLGLLASNWQQSLGSTALAMPAVRAVAVRATATSRPLAPTAVPRMAPVSSPPVSTPTRFATRFSSGRVIELLTPSTEV